MDQEGKAIFMTKSEYIYKELKKSIVTGKLRPNEKLRLSRVAEQFNASEAPVREAMKKLEMEKLVKSIPYVGVVVRELQQSEVQELFAIRAALEGLAIVAATESITEDDINSLVDIVNEMKKAIEANDVEAFGEYDKSFHLALAKLSNNKRLYNMIEGIWNETEQARAIFLISPEIMEQSVIDHEGLLEALKNKNSSEAEAIAKNHRLKAAKKIMKHLAHDNSKDN